MNLFVDDKTSLSLFERTIREINSVSRNNYWKGDHSLHDQDEKSRDTISISSSTIIGGCRRIDAVPPVREQVIGEQTGSAIMSDAFTPCKATILPGARSVPTLLPTQRLAQPGGSGLEKEGRWFRLEALNMSDLILSRRTLPPSLTRFTLQYVQTFRAQLRHGI